MVLPIITYFAIGAGFGIGIGDCWIRIRLQPNSLPFLLQPTDRLKRSWRCCSSTAQAAVAAVAACDAAAAAAAVVASFAGGQ